MSKKSFIILIAAIVLIVLLGLGIAVYLSAKKNNEGVGAAIKNFFPFGAPTSPVTATPNNPNIPENPGTVTEPGNQPVPRLRKVSNIPVVGYLGFTEQVPVDPNDLPPPTQKKVDPKTNFTKDLKQGDASADVKALEQMLNACPQTQVAKTGVGSPGKETTAFTASVKASVITFQELFADAILKPQNLSKGTGIVDAKTRDVLNAGYTCTIPAPVAQTVLKSVVRFVTEGNGNIFESLADTLATTRLSNTTIPRVHEAFFANGGASVIMRSLESDNQTIDSLIGTIAQAVPGGDAPPQLVQAVMPKNISDLSISPDGKQLLFMQESGQNLLGFTSDLDGKNQKRVFTSPFYSWLPQWATATELIFTVKPTGYATGSAYIVDLLKGGFTKIAGPTNGLTTLMSPNGKYLLVSYNTATGPELALETLATRSMRDLKLTTLPEKCMWTADSLSIYCAVPDTIPYNHIYPDDWYQGTVTFLDSFWLIDPAGLYDNRMLFNPLSEEGESTDGVRLSIDPTNKYLYFMNKDTGILWQYDLTPTDTTPAEQ